jgi:hypothetical protein
MPLIGLDPSSAEAGLGPTWSATGLQTETAIEKQAEADLQANPRPSFGDTLGAAFTTENAIYNSMQRGLVSIKNMFPETDDTALTPDDIYDQIRGTTYEPYYSELIGSKTQSILEGYKRIVDDRIKSKDTLERSGMASALTAGLIAGTLDIGTLMPGGTVYKSYKAGSSILKSAASVGAAGAAASSLTEAYLLDKQADRTVGQSVENVIADAIFSGAIGGGISGLSHGLRNRSVKDIQNVLTDSDGSIKMNEDGSAEVVGSGGIEATPGLRTRPTEGELASARQNVVEGLPVNDKGVPVKEDGSAYTDAEIDAMARELLGDIEVPSMIGGDASAAVTAKRTDGRYTLSDIDEDTLESEGLYSLPDKVKKYMVLSPVTRGLNSPFSTVRKFTNDVFQHNFILAKNVEGKTAQPALESLISLGKVPLYEAHTRTEKSYLKYVGVKPGLLQGARAKLQRGDKLSREEFGERVGKAMRRGDVDEIPEVAEAAKGYRAVIEPIKDRMIQMGLLPENVEVDTAVSYLTRYYNTNKLIASPTEFKTIVGNWLRDQNERLISIYPEVKRLEATLSAAKEKVTLNKSLSNAEELKKAEDLVALTQKQLDDLVPRSLRHADGTIREPQTVFQIPLEVDKIYDNIIGHSNERLLNPLLSRVGRNKGVDTTKQRAFLIPDELIEDFLDSNVNRVMDNYFSAAIPEIEIEDYFKKQGFADSTEGISTYKKSVIAEYEQSVNKALTIKNKTQQQNELKKLKKQLDRSLNAIDNDLLLLKGIYGIPKTEMGQNASRVGKIVRSYNMMRLLGAMVLSSLPDIAMPTIRHGFKAHVKDGILPVLKSMKTAKLSKAQWRDIGVGMETESSRRFMELASGPEAFYANTKFEVGFEKFSKNFGNIVLSNQWNDMMRGVASQVSSARIIRSISGYMEKGKLSKKDLLFLGSSRIPQSMYSRIYNQFKKYGDEMNGSYLVNHNDWDDLEARDVLKSAMLSDIDSTVIQPGIGDKPLFANTEIGKILLQFKSFGFASTNKILINGAQRRDAYVLQGIITMMALGAVSYYATSYAAGREPSDDITEIATEAIDRSGMLGLLMEPLVVADKFFGLSEEGLSRYRSRGPLGALLGPTADLLQDVSAISGKSARSIAGDADFNHNDLRRIKKLIVYQNLFYIRRLLEKGTDKIGQSLDLEGAPQ